MADSTKRIEELRRELAANPTSRQFYQLGELLRRGGRVSEAAGVLRSGLAHHPRYVAAWVALGRACVDGGACDEAATALREALALDAANPVAWRLLGEAHLALGDRRAALEAMQRCLELVPGDEVVEAAVEALAAETQPPARPPAMPPPAAAPKPAPAGEPFAAALAAVPAPPQVAPAAEFPFGLFATEGLAPMGGDVFGLEAEAAPMAQAGVFGALTVGEAVAEAAPELTALPFAPPAAEEPMAAVSPEPVAAATARPAAPPTPVEAAAAPFPTPERVAAAPKPPPRPVSLPATAAPRATVALARLYVQQQDLAGASSVLGRVLERNPSNVEARELLALVHDMMVPLPEPLPALSPRERKIAALQRWLVSITLGQEEAAP